jgi:hypothetical protein
MVKARRRMRRTAGTPGWVVDTRSQRTWNDRFKSILKRDFTNSDAAISAILSDERLCQLCATRIRSYVDKNVTLALNQQSKARGARHKKKLEIAIAGLRAAIDLCTSRGNQEMASRLGKLTDEFLQELGRCKQAFGTKRRGRDRDHSVLYESHSFLESKLRQSVTNATLANLVNAGYEADGNAPKEPITDEHIRKNLTHFKRNNPSWRNDIDPRFQQLLDDPETK